MNNQPPAVINLNLPKPPLRLIGAVLAVIAGLIVLYTSYYTVPAESEGVARRVSRGMVGPRNVGARA